MSDPEVGTPIAATQTNQIDASIDRHRSLPDNAVRPLSLSSHPCWDDNGGRSQYAVVPPAFIPNLEREALYAEFQPLVRRLIRQYGDDAEMRQDLAGEIFFRFCILLDSYDPCRGVPLRPYLVRQLTASIYTYARQHWRRQRREVSLQEGTVQSESAAPVDPSRQWDQEMMTRQVLEALPDVIRRLPTRQRQVVIWRYYEGRTFEEIAGTLGIQVSTARSLLRHGLNNLRRWIAHENVECA